VRPWGCAALFVVVAILLFTYSRIDEHFEHPETRYWTMWQVAKGFFLLATGPILIRSAWRWGRKRKHGLPALAEYWWLALAGLVLLHNGTVNLGAAYAWQRLGEFGVEEFGVAPGASFAEVYDRAAAAGFALDPADRSRVRLGLAAARESSCRFLHVRFRLEERFTFTFYEKDHLDGVTRFRISDPSNWAGGGFVDWTAVDGAWEEERR